MGVGHGETPRSISGEEIASCNCAWGCPCQFNALPTTGRCEAFVAWRIDKGYFGDTSLDGIVFASVLWFPGAVHEGNGKALHVVDEKATAAQRAAIEALVSGQHGGGAFEIFAAVTPNKLGTVSAAITFESHREARIGKIRIPGVGETQIEPITNPVTGETHRARIDLPDGFEFKLAEVGNTVACSVNSSGISFELSNTYAQLNPSTGRARLSAQRTAQI
jgi:hypothetical protein